MSHDVVRIDSMDELFPAALKSTEISQLWTIGRLEILNEPLLGVFCSAKCPGEIILKTFNIIRAIRDAGLAVIGGFHSPMEKESLDLLLRGERSLVICPAREIQHMRLPLAWRDAIAAGRALVISAFDTKYRQPTAELSERRNRLVGHLAKRCFVPHADGGSKTEQLCRELIQGGKSVFTIDSESNRHFLRLGARPLDADNIRQSFEQ